MSSHSAKNTDGIMDEAPNGSRFLAFLLIFALTMVGGLFLLPTPVAESQGSTGNAPEAFAIVGVRAFDGEEVLENIDVWLVDGTIKAIGQGLEIPGDVERIDGSGKTLMPGLIDAHVHAYGLARQDAARFGVTAMLDHFTSNDEVRAGREDREAGGATDRADLFSAGTLATAEGGHGTQYGMPIDTVDSAEEAESWVKDRLEEGSDWIKIVVEPGWGRSLNTLDAERVEALIEAAHAEGVLAVVHVSRLDDALRVTELGADGLVHIWRDRVPTATEIQKIKDSGLFVVPTLVVAEGMADPSPSMAMAEGVWGERLSPAQRSSLEARFPMTVEVDLTAAKESVRLLAEAGVPILAGSDAPNPATAMGLSQHREMALLVSAGLDPKAALVAATSAPARHFKLGGPKRGRLEIGALADLVLVEGNPLENIAATREIVRVWKAGMPIELEAPEMEISELEIAAAPEQTLLADFEAGLVTLYGAGWDQTTDQMRGGSSVAELEVVDGALVVSGEIKTGAMFPWSGAIVFPGPEPMQPVDLSARKSLVFKVRGEAGRQYSVMLFSGDMQGIPPTRTFETTDEWQTLVFELESFHQADPGSLRGLAFTAGAPAGAFRFELDDVEIR